MSSSLQDVDFALNRLISSLTSYTLGTGDAEASSSRHEDDSEAAQHAPPSIRNPQSKSTDVAIHELYRDISNEPYSLPVYVSAAEALTHLQYPDLAAGLAYKALMLVDACGDESDEYHEEAYAAVNAYIAHVPLRRRQEQVREYAAACTPPETFQEPDLSEDAVHEAENNIWVAQFKRVIYRTLIRSLYQCNCLKAAMTYTEQAVKDLPGEEWWQWSQHEIKDAVRTAFRELPEPERKAKVEDIAGWPDVGYVRRECYPWNTHEPDRLSELDTLNTLMSKVAPKLEVRDVELPALAASNSEASTTTQLGVFAKEDVAPGQVVLDETSMLTANNKLQDALCDACSADLPDLSGETAEQLASCPECEVIFCSQACHDRAMESYHPALCDMDVEGIAKDAPLAESADSLYSLLLLRTFAMAETQARHPLDLDEVKYIWGDFNAVPPPPPPPPPQTAHASAPNETTASRPSLPPRTLPFSFKYNIQLPFHMLEKMDVNIFTSAYADVWVFNTLYAKFRGTASARLSGLGGRAVRGPEVSAVHPMWCLANHSCDPNVSWEWGGSIKFWAREERVRWRREGDEVQGERERKRPGLRKGEEVLNHYCDIGLPVKERREWARGALGGDCRCERCAWEAGEGED